MNIKQKKNASKWLWQKLNKFAHFSWLIDPRTFLKHMERPRAKAKGHAGAFVYHQEVFNLILSHPEFFHQESPKRILKMKSKH